MTTKLKNHGLVSLVVVSALWISTGSVQAADPNTSAEIKALKARLQELENKVAAQAVSQPATAAAAQSSTSSPLQSALAGVQVSGMVDSTYGYNFNSPTQKTNVGRVFDRDSDSFGVSAAKLTLQKAVSADSPVGFRTDFLAGNDAEFIHSAGLFDSTDSFDLEQAFAEVNLGTSKLVSGMNDTDLKVGKFVSLAGAEVIESKDNWNTSRSYMFGFAVPFAHTGARLTYVFDNTWDIALGVNNGWDVFDDNNSGKTLETHVGLNNIAMPGDSSLTMTYQGYYGPETSNHSSDQRSLEDFVVTYKTPWKPLTLIYNFDYADEQHAASDGSTANWIGHAGYARIDLDDEWSISGRGEYFDDGDGVRVISGTGANYRELTATLEYRPWKNLITRVEYRNDHASKDVFNDSNSGLTDSQDTISGEVIFVF